MNIYCQEYLNLIQCISLPNKYTKIYIQICERAALRSNSRKIAKNLLGYVESHHIIPKSFNLVDTKTKENQVFLTAKEHFICHHLLVKMVTGKTKSKMYAALLYLSTMSKDRTSHKISARTYEFIRINFALSTTGELSPSWGIVREKVECEFCHGHYSKINIIKWHGKNCFSNPNKSEIDRPIINEDHRNNISNGLKIFYKTNICKTKGKSKNLTEEQKIDWIARAINTAAPYKHTKEQNKNLAAIMKERMTGRKWFTNGIKNTNAHECPEGYWIGKTNAGKKMIGRKCYTNGISNMFAFSCPDGYWLGMVKTFTNGVIEVKSEKCPEGYWTKGITQNKKWFTNGIKEIQRIECPDGYKRGRI